MSLERRIADALHAADGYEPSLDLFSRLHRSIDEDRAHRRRVRTTATSVAVGIALLIFFLGRVATRGPDGEILLPKWAVELSVAAVLTAVLIVLGPVLRRLGKPLLNEVFHLNPDTGTQFSRLLDIAYYLFFGGMIIGSIDPTAPISLIPLTSDLMWRRLAGIAAFLARLGVVHVANLAVLPLIGLLYTSSVRRSRRRIAGREAPPQSRRARQADRISTAIVMTFVVLAVVGTLGLIGLILAAIGFD